MKRKGLKTVLATIMCIFNLFVCFSGVLAWFVAAKNNQASGMQVQMYTHELDMSYRVYKWSEDEKAIINATGRNDALELRDYDSVITDRNHHLPIIIEFLVTGVALGDNIPLEISTECGDTTTTNHVLSNIISLKFGVFTLNSSDAATIYNTATTNFTSIDEECFVDGNTKNQTISARIEGYSDSIVNGALTLYIQLDYSMELIHSFTFDVTDSNTTTFTNDLVRINCSTSTGE